MQPYRLKEANLNDSKDRAYEGGQMSYCEKFKSIGEKDQWFFDTMLDVPKVHPAIAILSAPLNILPGTGLIICALCA